MTETASPHVPVANGSQLTRELIHRLLDLPDEDRAKVADLMWDSLDGPEDSEEEKQALRTEIARRIEDQKAGRTKTYTVEEFFAHVRSRLGEGYEK